MNGADRSKFKRVFAGVLAGSLLLMMLFAAFYVSAEAHHECTEEECPVCACIEQCEFFLQQLGFDGLVPVFVVSLLCAVLFISALTSEVFFHHTLVTSKVRMNA